MKRKQTEKAVTPQQGEAQQEKTQQEKTQPGGSLLEKRLERRDFFKVAGALAVSAGLVSSCRPEAADTVAVVTPESATPLPTAVQYPEVPYTPTAPPPEALQVFTSHEAMTVEALTARILPGTPSDPGAREAGVVYYIDNFLAYREGFPEPTYRHPPFAQTYGGSTPPAANGPGAAQTVWIPADQIQRYGYQSILSPREVYRMGVAGVDRYSNNTFGKDFVDLTPEQQDTMVGDMADGKLPDFDKILSAESFFHNLRRHTSEGMFSDPAYGGNRDMVGWKLVGYPGAQRAYTPDEYRSEGTSRQPQSMAQMHAFNPGQPANGDVILPVSGADMQHNP